MSEAHVERFRTLKAFLESDPENPLLLADFASAALEANEHKLSLESFEKLEEIEPLDGNLANMAGIAAMRSGDQDTAQNWFNRSLRGSPNDKSLLFNMAWSRALSGDFAASAELLEEELTKTLPQAAMLDMQIAHELGQFDDAAAKMETYLALHPDYAPLHAAASVLAMDVDRPDLAREAAVKGGAHPDALTTLATLDLGDHKLDEAQAQFESALAIGPANPRAELGRGLVELARGNHEEAAKTIDVGAEMFDTHLGSWIAAGWAYFLADQVSTARNRFERAMKIDDTFAEAHGSLAVLDIIDGDLEAAQRKAKIATRLDPSCFSAALAMVMINEARGNSEQAASILKTALNKPGLHNGMSLKDAIVKSAIASR